RPRPRTGRRGTSCPPTTSGCATWPSPRSSSTCSNGSTPRSRTRSRASTGSWSRRGRPRSSGAPPTLSARMCPVDVESRDSVSLKPAELDELGQLVSGLGLPLHDEQLDGQVEHFPLVAIAALDGDAQGFLFGSLERIGGTPCILWGLGAVRRGRNARVALDQTVGELYRRAAISFPDEDVLVAGRFAHPSAYALLNQLSDVCPRPKYSPTGEE